MSHELYYDSDKGRVVSCVTGKVMIDRPREMALQVAHLYSETGCRLLFNDMRAANINLSLLELFESSQIMSESEISQKIKRALVISPAFGEPMVLENVSCNRGHDFKVFEDIEEARKWFLSEQ